MTHSLFHTAGGGDGSCFATMADTDPLDSADFDAVALINAKFPDEAALGGGNLEAYVCTVRAQVRDLTQQITADIHAHSSERTQAKEAISIATTAIQEVTHSLSHTTTAHTHT